MVPGVVWLGESVEEQNLPGRRIVHRGSLGHMCFLIAEMWRKG